MFIFLVAPLPSHALRGNAARVLKAAIGAAPIEATGGLQFPVLSAKCREISRKWTPLGDRFIFRKHGESLSAAG